MKRWIVWAAIAAVMSVGCGGAGRNNSDNGDPQVAERFLNDLSGAVSSRDADFVASFISSFYLNDCQTKAQLVDQVRTTLNTPGAVSISMNSPSNIHVNDLRGEADFDATFDVTVGEGESQRSFDIDGRFHLKAENGQWHLYGNQACVH